MNIGKDGDAPAASIRPDAIIEAVGRAIDIGSCVGIAAAWHGGRAIDGGCSAVYRDTATVRGAATSRATIPAGVATSASDAAVARGSTFSGAAAARDATAAGGAARTGSSTRADDAATA